MKKRSLFSYLLAVTCFLGLTPVVRAGPVDGVRQLTEGLREVIYILIRFISDTLLQIDSFDQYLFAKILIFALVLLISYTVLNKSKLFGEETKNKAIKWIVASAVGILSIRYMPDEYVQAIMLQYNVFAVALTTFLPLIIYFLFIQQSEIGPFGRRLAWVVYIIALFSLWTFRYQDMGEANWIYWIAIGVALVSLIFDKKIHEYLGFSSIRKMKKEWKNEKRLDALRKLKLLDEDYGNGFYAGRQSEFDKKREHLERVIRENI